MLNQRIEQILRLAYSRGAMSVNFSDNCPKLELSENFGEEYFRQFLNDNEESISKLIWQQESV
jgi:hypothetical protein